MAGRRSRERGDGDRESDAEIILAHTFVWTAEADPPMWATRDTLPPTKETRERGREDREYVSSVGDWRTGETGSAVRERYRG